MKIKYFKYILLTAFLLYMFPSCFQDLGQNPPFNYPEEPEIPPPGEDGVVFYMPFDEDYTDAISNNEASVTGNPSLAEGIIGNAYASAQDGYLSFRLSDLSEAFGSDLTIGYWYKLNANPDRAGIIVVSPITEGADENAQNNRTSGFRIFREPGDNNMQRFKANVGNGSTDIWLDGGVNADIDPDVEDWVYFTLTITTGRTVFYIDGEEIFSNDLSEISWAGCDIMTIGSGVPRFTEWNHFSDNSLIDELRIFNKALTVEEINEIIAQDSE